MSTGCRVTVAKVGDVSMDVQCVHAGLQKSAGSQKVVYELTTVTQVTPQLSRYGAQYEGSEGYAEEGI